MRKISKNLAYILILSPLFFLFMVIVPQKTFAYNGSIPSISPSSATKTNGSWPQLTINTWTDDQNGSSECGLQVGGRVYWKGPNDSGWTRANWDENSSCNVVSYSFDSINFTPPANTPGGTYTFAVFDHNCTNGSGCGTPLGTKTINLSAPITCPSSSPTLSNYLDNNTLASYNNSTTLTWNKNGYTSFNVVVHNNTNGAEYSFNGNTNGDVNNGFQTISPVPSGGSANQSSGQILLQGNNYSWWLTGLKTGCNNGPSTGTGRFPVNKYPTQFANFAANNAGPDIGSSVTFSGNLQYLNTSGNWTNFPNGDNESVKVNNPSGTQLGSTATTGNAGAFSINYTVGSSTITADATFNGDTTYASTTTSSTGGTLTIIPQTTQTYCLSNKPSGSTSSTMQEQDIAGINFRICQNIWHSVPSGTAGIAWMQRLTAKNTTGSPITNRIDYESWICDPAGISDGAGHLSCADRRTPPGVTNSFITLPVPAGSIGLYNQPFQQTLQNTALQGGSGSGYCGSAQVDLFFNSTSSPSWAYADGQYSCQSGAAPSATPVGQARKPKVTCSASVTNQSVIWTANTTGGNGADYSYSWSGDDNLSGSGTSSADQFTNTISKTYACTNNCTKNATVTVTSGGTASDPTSCQVSITAASKPDLIVDSLTPTSAVVGTAVTFSGRVLNQGTATANSTTATITVPDASSQGSKTVNSLNANTSQNVTWNSAWTPLATDVGNHTFQICANAVANESVTTNNCTTQTITVSASPVFDFTLSNPNDVTVAQNGAAGTTTTTVTKINNTAPPEDVTITIDPTTPLPTGATSNSNTCKPTNGNDCAVSINIIPNSAAVGTYPIKLKGTSTTQSTGRSSTNFNLNITAGGGGGGGGGGGSGSISPWIQTVGGDIHSNTNINTPGGP